MKHEWVYYRVYEGAAKGAYGEIEISWCYNCGCLKEWELCRKIVTTIYYPVGSKPGRDDGLLEEPECKK